MFVSLFSIDEQDHIEEDGPLAPNKPPEEIRQVPYPIPEGFEWVEIDVEDVNEVCSNQVRLDRYILIYVESVIC
jgi:hypothetical protein